MKAHFKLNRAKIRFQNDKTHLRKAPGDRGFQMGKVEGLFSNCRSRKGIGHPGPLDQQGTVDHKGTAGERGSSCRPEQCLRRRCHWSASPELALRRFLAPGNKRKASGGGGAHHTATRSGISTGREGPVAPIPEPVLPFRD